MPTVERFHPQPTISAFLLTVGAFLLTVLSFLPTVGASPFYNAPTMRPEMITQIIRKQFFSVTDVCAIGKINSQRILLCNWHLQKVPHGGALITQNNSCQKALCNRCPV